MEVAIRAIETKGTIDARRRLVLDEPLHVVGPTRVRVLILLPEEDIYTLADGRPFYDQGQSGPGAFSLR